MECFHVKWARLENSEIEDQELTANGRRCASAGRWIQSIAAKSIVEIAQHVESAEYEQKVVGALAVGHRHSRPARATCYVRTDSTHAERKAAVRCWTFG